jgi:hypothetical protein
VLKECNDVKTSMVVGRIQYANIWFSCAPQARLATSWPATPGLGRKGRWRAVNTRGLKRWLGGRYILEFDRASTQTVPTLTLVAVQNRRA